MHVSPKAFALLEALIKVRPKAVSKDELHSCLWPETFVSDANLPNLVAELRESLGDDAHEPRIIRTVQRYGYAFRADATMEPDLLFGASASSGAIGRSLFAPGRISSDARRARHSGSTTHSSHVTTPAS